MPPHKASRCISCKPSRGDEICAKQRPRLAARKAGVFRPAHRSQRQHRAPDAAIDHRRKRQRENDSRKSQTNVCNAHEKRVDHAAADRAEHTDQRTARSDHRYQHQRRKNARLRADDHPREQIAAKAVRAKGMRPTRRFQRMHEILRVGIVGTDLRRKHRCHKQHPHQRCKENEPPLAKH